MSFVREFVLHALSAETTSGADAEAVDTLASSSGFTAPGGEQCRILLDVTAIGALDALRVKVESLNDRGTFQEIETFDMIAKVSSASLLIPNCPRRIRTSWVISGVNPTVTFETRAVRMV